MSTEHRPAPPRWACGHRHRCVAGMCMPALRQLWRAAVEMSIVEEIATREDR